MEMGVYMRNATRSGLLLLIAAVLFGACAEERDPIDRVQPYALPKTFFIGEDFQSADDDPEFWSQNSMVDVGYGAGQSGLFTSTYAQPMSRLKWQITEDMLIARASYERINYSDNKGNVTGLKTQDGVIVAVFPIVSHFDIVNSYNPTTGEKLNVIEENTYDRPWYEREYVRVDWSKNINTDSYDFDTLSLIGIYGGIVYEPLSYYVEDPNDEDAPYFDLEGGYFDVTTKAFAKPGLIDLSHLGWGIDSFPACYLDADFFGGTAPTGTCNPVELTLRHSFRRVVDNDFQPLEWDGWRFQAFGGFAWTERMGYARNYGMTDALHHRFLSRFQIWERAHYYDNEWNGPGTWAKAEDNVMEGPVECYTPSKTGEGGDPHRDEDGNGTADECEAVTAATGFEGSQCDTFTQKCTLPFRARTPLKLAWYYTNKSDRMYFDATENAVHQWDVGLRTAVRAAQYSECMYAADGGNKENCVRDWPMYFGQQDDNDDAFALAQEVDDCRHSREGVHEQCRNDDPNTQLECCAKLAESIGGVRGVSEGVKSIAQMDETIVLCHSPVEFNDSDVCAPADQRLPVDITADDCATARAEGNAELLETCLAARNVRRGDLRYHLANVIEEPGTGTPWGIMTSAVDPVNGQTIQSCSNVWAWVNGYWAQRLVDYMRFAAGELSPEDVTEAEYIKDWSKAAEAASRGGVGQTLTKKELGSRIDAFLGREAKELDYTQMSKKQPTDDSLVAMALPEKVPGLGSDTIKLLKDIKQEFTGVMANSELASTTNSLYTARMNKVRGTEIEAQLMNKQMQQLYGVEDMYMSTGLMDMVSPLRGGNLAVRRDMERLKQSSLANRGMCEIEATAAPVAINGLSKIMQEKFTPFSADDDKTTQRERADKMIEYIAQKVHTCVIVHEMGHAMAHRHNFVSSSDSMYYRPQYWQLRTKDGAVNATTKLGDMTDPSGESSLGPRYFDPVTPAEEDNLIWMWSHSSVMDYPGEASQDFLTLGAWDMAALRMFYGDTAPVYPLSYANPGGDMGYTLEDPRSRAIGLMKHMDNFGGIIGFQYEYGTRDLHYSQLNTHYELIKDCAPVDTTVFKQGRYDEEWEGEFHPVLDAFIVSPNGDGVYTKCRQPEVDYVPWRTLRPPIGNENPGGYIRAMNDDETIGSMIDQQGRMRVPYGFATDSWADIGNAAVYRHDNGADTYEIFNWIMTQQELFQIFDTYRRGRLTFSVSGASGRINGRYNGKIRDGAKGLALQRNYMKARAADWGVAANVLWDFYAEAYWSDSIIASTMVFDHFIRLSQRPQAGDHFLPAGRDTLYSLEDSAWSGNTMVAASITVPNGAYGTDGAFGTFSPGGKLVENRLDSNQGEYASSYTVNAGSYYDKIWTSMMMTESADHFISDSRGDFVDARYRATSMADLLPDGYRRWLANSLTNDEFLKGARVATTDSGTPITDGNMYPVGGIGTTQWWSNPPQACFPVEGTNICSAYGVDGWETNDPWNLNDAPEFVRPLESQLGWEVQKYLVTWTYIYLPENDSHWWRDMMRMSAGSEYSSDIQPDPYLFFFNPTGRFYAAKKFGTEEIFGKTVEKGIAARVVEYANSLLMQAYETQLVDLDGDGNDDAYQAVFSSDSTPIVLYDPSMEDVYGQPIEGMNCDATDNSGCTCEMNAACMELENYIPMLDWLEEWSGYANYGTNDWDSMTGVYG